MSQKLFLLLFVLCVAGCQGDGGEKAQSSTAPEIETFPPTTAIVGKLLRYDVDAADVDNDPLSYSLDASPSGMGIDERTGIITWTPLSSQVGDHNVTIAVTDGTNKVTQSFTLSVSGIREVASGFVSASTGGVVTVNDASSAINGLSVNIPANALPADETIRIVELTPPPALGGGQDAFLLGFSLEPDGLVFNNPVTITIPYSSSAFDASTAVSEEDLVVYLFDSETSTKSLLEGISTDTAQDTIVVKVDHFSEYVVTPIGRLVNPPIAQSSSPFVPVILVHGFQAVGSGFGGEGTWGNLPDLLATEVEVSAWQFEYDSRDVSFRMTAAALGRAVSRVKSLTGQQRVNILAHSFGGIVTRTYIQDMADNFLYRQDVNKVMTLGTPHRGIGGNLALRRANTCISPLLPGKGVTCKQAGTGEESHGNFLRDLNGQPLPILESDDPIQYHIIIGRRFDDVEIIREEDFDPETHRLIGQSPIPGDIQIRRLREDDSLITTLGADICVAFGEPSGCTAIRGNPVKVETLASNASDIQDRSLCHTTPLPDCGGIIPLNIPMAQVDDVNHPLWSRISDFLTSGSEAIQDPSLGGITVRVERVEPSLALAIGPFLRFSLEEATVVLTDADGRFINRAITDDTGQFTFANVQPGSVRVLAEKARFNSASQPITVLPGAITNVELLLGRRTGRPTGNISGTIFNGASGSPVANATLKLRKGIHDEAGDLIEQAVSNASGEYAFTDIPAGTYTIFGFKDGFAPNSFIVVVIGGETITGQDGSLIPKVTEVALIGSVPDVFSTNGGTFTISVSPKDKDGNLITKVLQSKMDGV